MGRAFRWAVLPLVALGPACGADESPIASSALDGDGSVSTGGRFGSGGSRSGGAPGRGGSHAGGGNAGGANTGGANGTGGLNAVGADAGAGGANADGGSGAGGSLGNGGVSNDASADGSGGSGGSNTGGESGSGGSNTGGSSGAGGVGTGGASTGSAPNDGGATSSIIFVNPTTGDDANSGFSSAEAVKTIVTAAGIAGTVAAPRTILLEDGIYDSTTQSTWNLLVPVNTIMRGVSSTGVTLHGEKASIGPWFMGGGALRNVTFDTFDEGVRIAGNGTFDIDNVHFVNVNQPLAFLDSIVATVDAGGSGTFAVPPAAGFAPACLVAAGSPTVTFRNGTFQNVPGNDDGQIFAAYGQSKLTIDSTLIDTSSVRAIAMYDNADVVLMNSRIHRVSQTTTGPNAAAIYMGAQDSQVPFNQSLEISGSDITMNQVPGVSAILYGATASKPIVKFTSSHVESNEGSGFVVSPVSTVSAAAVNTVQVIDSTFKNNKLAGITMPVGDVTIAGGEFSGNGGDGIAFTSVFYQSSLKVRGTVKIDSNGGHGISFAATSLSTFDLGKTADPGGITFTGVAAGHSAVNLQAALRGFSVGNAWMPNVQGANASGLYTMPTTISSGASGLNATVVSGGSLVVAE